MSVNPPNAQNLGFDPDELAERYRQERDKRVRADAEHQYIHLAASPEFAHYRSLDPFAPEATEREPLTDEVEVLVIGGGWFGLLASARLVEAGVTDLRIVEAGADFGGAWYWNRYPGAQCDIESYVYMPCLRRPTIFPSSGTPMGRSCSSTPSGSVCSTAFMRRPYCRPE